MPRRTRTGREWAPKRRLSDSDLSEIKRITLEGDPAEALFLFAKVLLKRDRVLPSPHLLICQHLMHGFNRRAINEGRLTEIWSETLSKKMLLSPRGSFKTTFCAEALPVFLLCQEGGRNLRILISGETLDNSKKHLRAIKSHLTDPDIVAAFGSFRMGTGWAEYDMMASGRTHGKGEPTVRVSGCDQTKTGQHCDISILDDLLGESNYQSHTGREKVIRHFNEIDRITDPGGYILVDGTRWHPSDLYGFIEENLAEEYSILRLQAIDEGNVKKLSTYRKLWSEERVKKEGDLLFPEWLSRSFLEKKRNRSEKEFQGQYQNSPTSEQGSIGSCKEYMQFPPEGNISTVIAVDPASATEERSDYSGIWVGSMTQDMRLFVWEADQRKMDAPQLRDYIFSLARKYEGLGLQAVVVEKAGGDTFTSFIREGMSIRGHYFRFIEATPQGRTSKEDRIVYALEGWYKSGKVIHHSILKNSAYETQLRFFPDLAHDDIIDAAAWGVKHLRRPAGAQTDHSSMRRPGKDATMEERRMYRSQNPFERSYQDKRSPEVLNR